MIRVDPGGETAGVPPVDRAWRIGPALGGWDDTRPRPLGYYTCSLPPSTTISPPVMKLL